jgi:hypothetical protein
MLSMCLYIPLFLLELFISRHRNKTDSGVFILRYVTLLNLSLSFNILCAYPSGSSGYNIMVSVNTFTSSFP